MAGSVSDNKDDAKVQAVKKALASEKIKITSIKNLNQKDTLLQRSNINKNTW